MSPRQSTGVAGLWDPASEIPVGSGRLIWTISCVLLCLSCGRAFLADAFIPAPSPPSGPVFVPDLFQDYASARNYLAGLDPYSNLEVSARRYLNLATLDSEHPGVFKVNAHPPAAILLVLPLAKFDFKAAFAAWNLASLALVGLALALALRSLGVRVSGWAIFPAVAFVLLSQSLRSDLRLGQFSLLLLFLLVGVWAADRSGRHYLAGVLLAAATSIKLFPGFLIVYFLLRRRWATVFACALATVAIALLTVGMFGAHIYDHYFMDVCPRFAWFRNAWYNASIAGFWGRLFDTAPAVQRDYSPTRPLAFAPGVALILDLASDAVIVGLLAQAVRKSQSKLDDGWSFSLAVVGMLLVSPIAWDHYLIMLLVPFLVSWRDMGRSSGYRWLLLLLVYTALILCPIQITPLCLSPWQTASPVHSVTILSVQFYALLAMFMIGFRVVVMRREAVSGTG